MPEPLVIIRQEGLAVVQPDPSLIVVNRGQQGPAGPSGPAGSAGSPGTPGAAGAQGVPGMAGPPGPEGPEGSQGVPGAPGGQGPQGQQGIQGVQGNEGPAGKQGPTGVPGYQGEDGPEGLMGPPGPQGPQGPQGDGGVGQQGPAGATGRPGLQGEDGEQGLMGPPGPAGAQGPAGPDGSAGSAGSQGPAGVQGPPGFVGDDGEQGPMGPPGPTGPQGPAGSDGSSGSAGSQGPQGLQGVAGPPGMTGDDGDQGMMGLPGLQGIQGIQGPAGADGTLGATGPAGPQGPIGIQGLAGDDGEAGLMGPPGTNGTNGTNGAPGVAGQNGGQGERGAPGLEGEPGEMMFFGFLSMPGGLITHVQYNDGQRFGGDASFTYDKANPAINVNASTASTKGVLTANQPQTRPALLITGTGTDGVGDAANGYAFWLTHNGSGNRQLVFGQSQNFNVGTVGCFRFGDFNNGGSLPSIDGVTGNGGSRTLVNIGNDTHGLTVCANLAYNASPTAAFRTYGISGAPAVQISHYSSGTQDLLQLLSNGGTVQSFFTSAGFLSVNKTTNSAQVHIGAGGTAASSAPLKFTSGSLMTTPEAGAVEYDGDRISKTGSVAIREFIVGCIFTKTTETTITNTTTETSVVGTGVGTVTLPANFLKVGKTLRITAMGVMNCDLAASLTPKVKLGSTVIDTGSVAPSMPMVSTPVAWKFEAICTCKTTGASGTLWTQGIFTFFVNSGTVMQGYGSPNTATVTIDTTAQQAADLTFTWGTASSGNSITCTNLVVEVLN